MVSGVIDPVSPSDDEAVRQPASNSPAEQLQARRGALSSTKTDALDLAAGQIVIITARWILVVAGLLFALWNADALNEVRLQIGILLVLAVANFFLHAHVLMRRPVPELVVYSASGVDVLTITLLLISQGGIQSGLYVYYFPAVLAFSVVFPTLMTAALASTVLALYSLVSLVGIKDEQELQLLVTRLIMLAAIAFCGHLYWRVERRRRQSAAQSVAALLAAAQPHGGQQR